MVGSVSEHERLHCFLNPRPRAYSFFLSPELAAAPVNLPGLLCDVWTWWLLRLSQLQRLSLLWCNVLLDDATLYCTGSPSGQERDQTAPLVAFQP